MAKRSWMKSKLASDSVKAANKKRRIEAWDKKLIVADGMAVSLQSVGEGLWSDFRGRVFVRKCDVNGIRVWTMKDGVVRECFNWC